jgi:hypothetical protein
MSYADAPVAVVTGMAGATSAAHEARSRRHARSRSEDTRIERLVQGLEARAVACGLCIQAAHAVVRPRHAARYRHMAAADPPHIRDGVVGGHEGRAVTNAVWAMLVLLMASARVMAGKMLVSRRASIDLPAPGEPSRGRLWLQRLHPLSARKNRAERQDTSQSRSSLIHRELKNPQHGSLTLHVQNFPLTAFLPSSPRRHNREIIDESTG